MTDSYVNKEYVVRLEALVEQLEAEVTRLREAVEWALSTGGAIHDDQISSWLIELDRRAKEG